MNIESEVTSFSELSSVEQARFLARLMYELTLEARGFYSPAGEAPIDALRLRFLNEIQHRLTRYIEQILTDDPSRPGTSAMIRLVLAPRAEKAIEDLMRAAWSRTVQATA